MKTLNKVTLLHSMINHNGGREIIIFMTLLVFLYSALILLRMLLLIPAFNNFFHSMSLGTESKAFLKSRNMRRYHVCSISCFQLRNIGTICGPDRNSLYGILSALHIIDY